MSSHPAKWWTREGGHIRCRLCPRHCLIAEGQKGFCGIRRVEQGALLTDAWACASGLCADPIEKKPLYHFLPGSLALSFGMVGCNLACVFCQNWKMSQECKVGRMQAVSAAQIVEKAKAAGCECIAFTYNEPIISAEWCMEVAQACHRAGLRTVAVSSGYIAEEARDGFFGYMDAANVDLKGFSEAFYRRHCAASLEPVLATLESLAGSGTWLEVTTLLIPGENDDEAMLLAQCQWMREKLGVEVPLHFSAFHPDYKMLDKEPTSLATLRKARKIAVAAGLRHVYIGNVRDRDGSSTRCPGCRAMLIERDAFALISNRIAKGRCPDCGREIAGVF